VAEDHVERPDRTTWRFIGDILELVVDNKPRDFEYVRLAA
jgi:hypothetical protein